MADLRSDNDDAQSVETICTSVENSGSDDIEAPTKGGVDYLAHIARLKAFRAQSANDHRAIQTSGTQLHVPVRPNILNKPSIAVPSTSTSERVHGRQQLAKVGGSAGGGKQAENKLTGNNGGESGVIYDGGNRQPTYSSVDECPGTSSCLSVFDNCLTGIVGCISSLDTLYMSCRSNCGYMRVVENIFRLCSVGLLVTIIVLSWEIGSSETGIVADLNTCNLNCATAVVGIALGALNIVFTCLGIGYVFVPLPPVYPACLCSVLACVPPLTLHTSTTTPYAAHS